jgi:SSS family solute:Na+ symporter
MWVVVFYWSWWSWFYHGVIRVLDAFTGLLGAWLSAVFLIPKVSHLGHKYKFFTFPQIFNHFYNPRVALLAGIISAIGYVGFTSSQVLAGEISIGYNRGLKLTNCINSYGIDCRNLYCYRGLKAVIYTDTIQWLILIGGLVFIEFLLLIMQ